MEGALTVRQVINEGESSFATETREELEENPSPVVDENNVVSARKQGPNLHNWSSDWSFWNALLSGLFEWNCLLQFPWEKTTPQNWIPLTLLFTVLARLMLCRNHISRCY